MTNLVGSIVQAVAERIPHYGQARSCIIAVALIGELVLPKLGKIASIKIIRKCATDSDLSKNVNAIDIEGLIKGLNKACQIVACLGATRVFSSYWVSIPVTCVIITSCYLAFLKTTISRFLESTKDKGAVEELNKILMLINNPVSLLNNVFLGLDVCAKIVNIFAMTLFAKQLFSNKHASAVASSVAFLATCSMSAYNLYPHLQSKQEVPKNSQEI